MEYDAIKPARLLIILMKLFGFWNFEGQRFNRFYKFYVFLIHSVFSFLITFAMLINVSLAKNIDEFAEALYIPLPVIVFLFKALNYIILSRNIVDFLTIIEYDIETLPRNAEEFKMLEERQKSLIKFRNLFIFGCICNLLDNNIQSLLDNEYNLPFQCWIPFDYRNPKKFLYAFFYVSISMNIIALGAMTIDLFQAYLLSIVTSYFKLIALRMENYSLPENIEQLKRIIKLHQFTERMVQKCQDIISIPVFAQIVMSASIICFTIYKLLKLSLMYQTADFLAISILGIVMALEIYLPCYYGNEITLSAEGLVNAIYNLNWMDMSPQTKKLIFVYMEYLNHPIRLKAGGFFDIGLEIFTKAMNNAYSLYALLLNFQD